MAILIKGISGLTGLKAQILAVDAENTSGYDGYVWDGSGLVNPTGITSAAIVSGMLSLTEISSNDSYGLGLYTPSPTWPTGLSTSLTYEVRVYQNPTYCNETPIGEQLDPTQYQLSKIVDVYHADIDLSVDAANSADEYTVVWFKNGIRITSGITNAVIQVINRSDGSDLISETSMTEVGSIASYKYTTTTKKITAGEAVIMVVSATIDGSTRSFARTTSRDSSV